MPRAVSAQGTEMCSMATWANLLPTRKPADWACALLVAATLPILVVGCSRNPSRDGDRPGFVVVSGDTSGWIRACSCASNQSGGLPRRGAFVEQLRRRGDVLLLDVGGNPGGDSEYERVKFEAILTGTTRMGLVAQNVGGPEVLFGADYLRDVAQRLGIPFVSANVRDARGELIAEPLRLAELSGRRIGITGVLSPEYATSGVRVEEPREAVLRLLDSTPRRYDSLIVLAYLPETELHELAAALPEADVVVGGPTGQGIAPRKIGPTLLTSATNKGKFLVQLKAGPASAAVVWSAQLVEMHDGLGDDPAQNRIVEGLLAELERRDFAANRTGFVTALTAALPAEFRVAGSNSCRACHAAEWDVWESTGHAHAWQALAEHGNEVDPYCQRCHTTGYGLPGGFVSAKRSGARVDVGCEGCHGPSLAHARELETRTAFAAADQCAGCHDLDNSPSFDYGSYWPRIRHGPTVESTVSEPSAATKPTGGP